MCYNIAYTIEKTLKRLISRERDPDAQKRMMEFYEDWKVTKRILNPGEYPFASAFTHPELPILFRTKEGNAFGFFKWGLVPRWCNGESKALQLWNHCLNARADTIFDKSAFRSSALDRRCVIMLDGFYEYHHRGKMKYPFFITGKNEEPMFVAGLWDSANIDGVQWLTFTMVTTSGNALMRKIHNSPVNPNRMPVLLMEEQIELWLEPTDKGDKATLEMLLRDVLIPAPDEHLQAHTVGPLTGKNGSGNTPRAKEKLIYKGLELT